MQDTSSTIITTLIWILFLGGLLWCIVDRFLSRARREKERWKAINISGVDGLFGFTIEHKGNTGKAWRRNDYLR